MKYLLRISMIIATILFGLAHPALAELGGDYNHPAVSPVTEAFPMAMEDWSSYRPVALGSGTKMTFTEMVRKARAGDVVRIEVPEGEYGKATAVMKDGTKISVHAPTAASWPLEMVKEGIEVDFERKAPEEKTLEQTVFSVIAQIISWLFAALGVLAPIFLLFLMFYMAKSMFNNKQVGELILPGQIKTRFTDVAGAEDGKQALMDVVEYLKNPEKFERLGARARKGVLLVGSPGNGKTLLARAVAGEAGVPFMAVSGSNFNEMFVGLGAARVRRIFQKLKKIAPCVLFIDEIDSVGRERSSGGGAAENENANTLNQLLTQMDGIKATKGIVFIAATNRVDVLDPALIRAGRFDLQVMVQPPDMRTREKILVVSAKDVLLDEDVDMAVLARGTPGFSGADLSTLVNEAAIRAGKRGAESVAMMDFEAAREAKIMGGEARTGVVLDDEEIETISIHEAGHAVVSIMLPGCDPIHKGTIAPRGSSLGHVAVLPERESVLHRRDKLLDVITMLMAGRAAEEIRFGEGAVTSGSSSDAEKATVLARSMVTEYGFGASASNRKITDRFSGRGVSDETHREVDREVEAMVAGAFDKAKEILVENEAAWRALAAELRAKETLSGDEIREIVASHRQVELKRPRRIFSPFRLSGLRGEGLHGA